MKKQKLQKVFLYLLIFSIFFSPRLGKLRIQDFVLALTIIIWISSKKQTNKFYLAFLDKDIIILRRLIISSLIVSLLINIVYLSFGKITFNPSFIYFFKELQYYILFAFFSISYLFSNSMLKVFNIFMGIQVAWGLWQIASGKLLGFYGIGLIGETGPSQTGLVYYMSFALAIGYLIDSIVEKSKIRDIIKHILFTTATIIVVMATASRTAIIAMGLSIILSLLIILFKKPMMIFITAYLSIPASLFVFISLHNKKLSSKLNLNTAFERLSRFSRGYSIRIAKWQKDINMILTYKPGWLIGMGTAIHNILRGTSTLGADNQYLRILYEKGFIGLAFWLMIIFKLASIIWNNKCYLGSLFYSWFLVLLGMLITSVTHEVFYVVKISESFWLLSGIVVGKILLNKQRAIDEKT